MSYSVALADITVGGGSSQAGTISSGPFNRETSTTVRAEADQISQEGVETFEIPLSVISDVLPVPVFVEEPAIITVVDRSGKKMINTLEL